MKPDAAVRTRPEDYAHEKEWYRCKFEVSLKSASITEAGDIVWHNRYDPKVEVYFMAFPVLRHTECGVWLANTYDWHGNSIERRFVLRAATKRWACPTPEEAFESLLARSERRQGILENQLKKVRIGIAAAKTGKFIKVESPMEFMAFEDF